MHAYGPVDFALAAKQTAQGKMQIDCLRFDLDHLDKCFDGLIRLLVEQKVEPLEV